MKKERTNVSKMFSLSQDTAKKFDELMLASNYRTRSDLIESLIVNEYDKLSGETSLEDVYELLRKLAAAVSSLELTAYQNRDMLNSLCYLYEVPTLRSAEDEPHHIVKKSAEKYRAMVHAKSLQKATDRLVSK